MQHSTAPLRPGPFAWLWAQPYLLLSLTSLFWAGNIVMGRFIAGHVPPVALSFVRWGGAFLLIFPFAWPHMKRDWPTVRQHPWIILILSLTGIGAYNTIAYYGLQYTQALNASLMQSAGPLFVAFWALLLYGIRPSPKQGVGILISLAGVLVIVLHGDFATLTGVQFNIGDILFLTALFIFGLYSAIAARRPKMHPMSFLGYTIGLGAFQIVPILLWEISTGYTLKFDALTIGALIYAATMPSLLAYLFFNRGVELIGPNRASPFFHLMPVFGSALAILFLGETPHLYHAAGYALVLAGIFIAARK